MFHVLPILIIQACSYIPSHSPGSTLPARPRANLPTGTQAYVSQTGISAGPTRVQNLLNPLDPPPRFQLWIRQQPIAARACAAGEKDRRPLDPPPILQLLVDEFDPKSKAYRDILQNKRLAVNCLLYLIEDVPQSYSTHPPQPSHAHARIPSENLVHRTQAIETRGRLYSDHQMMEISQNISPEKQGQLVQILSGNTFTSPFCVEEDPDPSTAPGVPITHADTSVGNGKGKMRQQQPGQGCPATFFIFPDLSVRSPGWYRLKFRLCDWGSVHDSGVTQPILAEVWSEVFRVYTSKDFPGMKESSLLTNKLKELGAKDLKTRGKPKGKEKK